MKRNWFKYVGVITIIFMLLISSACSSDEASSSTGKNSTGEPKKGGTVTSPIVGDPIFNPWHPNAYAESNVVNRIIFSGLTKPGKDNAPSPSLATEWSASEDGLVWTFKLREGVKWHDGEPFTAEDVAFTFNDIVLNKELGSNGASNYKAVDNVKVVNDHIVEFHLKNPWAALPAYLGFNSEIIPKHKFEGQNPWELTSFNKEKPVGTGPFKVGTYISGQSVELIPNEDFFGGAPHLDKFVYKILAEKNTHVAQALSNELDIFVLEDKASLERIKQSKNLEVLPSDANRYFWISLNQENPMFTDLKVRQAFLHAIDRQAIIDSVLKGFGKIADAAITPQLSTYYTDDVKRYDYDPAKAKALFEEAGWKDSNGDGILDKDGKPFKFEFDIGIQGDLEPIAQMVQQYLKEVGLDVKLNTLEWNAMIQKNIIERDFDMILNWWAYPADPDVYAQYHSSNAGKGNNIPGYKDAKLDELLVKGQQTSDPAARGEVYKEMQQYMAENLPYLYLWYPEEIQIRNKKLKGVPDMYFGGALHYVNEWYIQQ
ncbi:ABC transporter substrate-binding protein [Bacillus sp. B-jedd]|uniref:ABC transporter substrate-binding protein n=1 Tax=Bacillus sp. B-jedd TaxID=1476857 RepID=UPI0005156013|nr:ABC transporter substrate-binding protein [Bacillus sp. B-jedd]CEG28711.1 periplasmic binding protein AppA [Bacillus sp. B-jedd]